MFKALKMSLTRTKEPAGLSPGLDFLPDGYAERRRIRRTNAFAGSTPRLRAVRPFAICSVRRPRSGSPR